MENPKDLSPVRLEPDMPVAKRPEAAPNVVSMMQAVIDKGVTGENVAALEKLVDLYERMDNKDAERAFARAFNELQQEMPKIKATQPVPNNDGTVRYKFAPFESIMEQVQPMLQKHGFTVSFSTRYDQNRLVKICTLTHIRGHSRTNEFAVRIGSGPPKASESQADGAAGTYAKRFALCDMLNIVVEKDSDAAAEGGPISRSQAQELRERVLATGSDEKRFLAFAGAKTYEEIPSGKLAVLDDMLRKRESTR